MTAQSPRHDPFADPADLVLRLYAYVAYRIGAGPDAEDITSATVERGLRHRASYDRRKGEPIAWLIGIARRCIVDALAQRTVHAEFVDVEAPGDSAAEIVLRLDLEAAVSGLSARDRELIALRFGADLTTRQIATLVEMSEGAVDVAIHRALERLRGTLEGQGERRSTARRPWSKKEQSGEAATGLRGAASPGARG